ncbi:MAG: metal ABC transporter substrate-binding protein [Ruminococcus flavefaciens]|nr:metal ABC transporter substrate-binding protein [Ruminococcus flavefaciens]MCM1229783.1 metal ABC transporter substrate-binding protein [Ruminococcus flavefaciens]
MLKKFISAVSAVIISTAVFTGCTSAPVEDDGKINVICTVFSVYDWTKNIVGDSGNINLTYLLGNGSDLHNFQPTADDIIKISSCDVFIYVGGESDEWIEDILDNAVNQDMKVVNLLDVLADSAVEEEIKEGMAHGDEDSDETEYDEHIWLSLSNAKKCVSEITSVIISADSDGSAEYTANSDSYIAELSALDSDFHSLFDNNPQTLIFGDRFPFRYFVEDYNLDYFAAFTGCSADTQASFETITFLAKKADELNADTVFTIENSDCTIADAVIENTSSESQNIAVLDSIQSVTDKQINDGTTYLSIMKKNYDILQEVFK